MFYVILSWVEWSFKAIISWYHGGCDTTPKKLDSIHQTVFPHERVGSGDKTTTGPAYTVHKNGRLEEERIIPNWSEFIASTENSNTYAQLHVDMLLSMCWVFYF